MNRWNRSHSAPGDAWRPPPDFAPEPLAARFSQAWAKEEELPSDGSKPREDAAVTIHPTRETLTGRFPVLGFTIHTPPGYYFEVLLTTDASLFDPSRAEQRTGQTFYSSRFDSGLTESTGEAVYLVPPGVLARLIRREPQLTRAIYYTLIAYADPEGNDPQFAHPPQQLPQHAPSVAVAADFAGQAQSRILGVALSNLKRVGASNQPAQGPGGAPGESATGAVDADRDRGEGEDGYGIDPEADSRTTPAGGIDAAVAGGATKPRCNCEGECTCDPQGDEADQTASADTGDDAADPAWAAEASATATRPRPRPLKGVDTPPVEQFEYDDGFGPLGENELFEHAGDAATSPADEGTGSCAPTAQPEAEPELAAASPSISTYRDEAELDDEGLSYASLEAGEGEPSQDEPAPAARPLDQASRRQIIEDAVPLLSDDGGYDRIAYDDRHGLVMGPYRFSQSSGELGRLLELVRRRDAATFESLFGSQAEALLGDLASPDREARMAANLDAAEHRRAFQSAAATPLVKAAMHELADAVRLEPMLPIAGQIGLATERGLTLMVGLASLMGADEAIDYVLESAGPLKSPAHRQAALAALGYADVESFQAAAGLPVDGQWDAATHAGVIAELRPLGSASPVPIPPSRQMVGAIVARAEADGMPPAARMRMLHDSPHLSDEPFETRLADAAEG